MVRVESEDRDLVHAFLWLVRDLSQEEVEQIRVDGVRIVSQGTISNWRNAKPFKGVNASTRRRLTQYVEEHAGGEPVSALSRAWRRSRPTVSTKGRGYDLVERLSELDGVPLKQRLRIGWNEILTGAFHPDEIATFDGWRDDVIREAIANGEWEPGNP